MGELGNFCNERIGNEVKKVLIINDSPFFCRILSDILSPEYEAITAASGEVGFMLAKKTQPILILLDVVLPRMNGFEVIRQLKLDESTKRIPVIFVTGSNSGKHEEEAFSLGAADYIKKPFKANIVYARVKNCVEHYSYLNKMEEIAMCDNLTGIFNRRAWELKLHAAWERAKRLKKNISIIMIDVDYFKQYNDAYGHRAGDRVLRSVAEMMKGCIASRSRHDFAARYGGEEFCVVFFGVTQSRSMRIAEKMRADIENLRIPHPTSDASPYVTVSMGGYTLVPTEDDTKETFIERADEILYLSKKSGRNRLLWR